jgi:putative transposase
VIPVSGKGSGRISVAGLVCVKPGQRSRLLYRIKVHRPRKGERRSFAETDYIALLDAAHQYLKAPIVVIWDNLNVHVSAAMRELAANRDWLHIVQLPAYSPDLNPTEAVWGPTSNAAWATSPPSASTTSPPSSATGSNASSTGPNYWPASLPTPA